MRAGLVLRHLPRIADHVGDENDSELRNGRLEAGLAINQLQVGMISRR